jgi:hypothetical protein
VTIGMHDALILNEHCFIDILGHEVCVCILLCRCYRLKINTGCCLYNVLRNRVL